MKERFCLEGKTYKNKTVGCMDTFTNPILTKENERVEKQHSYLSGKATLIFTPDCDTFIYVPEYHNSWMVKPETVGRYTGLTDKNGTRIFEGDILIYEYDGEYDPDEKYLVAWDNDEAAFRVNYYLKGEYIHYESITSHQYFEIVGNIHDNPELLEGE